MLRSSFSALTASHQRAAVCLPLQTCSRSFFTDSNVAAFGIGELPTCRHQALTLLHKTTSLLPRTLARAETAAHPSESLEFWNEILAAAYDDLTRTEERHTRIAIYGLDKWSGARDIVTALLHGPFASDSQNDLIKNRWQGQDRPSLIIEGVSFASPATEKNTLRISSAFLDQFIMPVQITEINPPPSSNSLILNDEKVTATLCKADIPVIVCNPLTTPLAVLLASTVTLNNPNTVLVLTSSSTTQVYDHVKALVQKQLDQLKIIFVDPWRALHGLEVLRSDPTSPLAVQRFQDDFTGSRISVITDALTDIFAQVDHTTVTRPTTVTTFHTYTTLTHVRNALATCSISLQRAEREIDTVCTVVSSLRSQIEEAKMKVYGEVLGIPVSTPKGFEDTDEVGKSWGDAEKKIKVVLDWLTWQRFLGRVDEVGIIMGDAVDKAWCKDLEKKLILHTGRLIALQQTFTSSTFALFSFRSPASPFSSALFLNSLHQLSSSPSYPLTASALTTPLQTRRTQLEYPIMRLQLAGQKAAYGMGSGIVAGVGMAWAGSMGWLAGSADGILGFLGMEAGTAVAVGMLSALLSVRWAIGKWEMAKRRWLEDWRRVGDGLGRDLKTTLDRTMQNNVVVVAERASLGLEDWAVKRKEEVEEIREELLKLEEDVGELQDHMRR